MIDKNRKYSPQQEAFLEALGGEARGNIKEAMRLAGYAKSIKQVEIIKSLKHEIIDIAETLLASNAPSAVFGMMDVLEDPNMAGAKNLVNVAKELLDRAGIVKKEQIEIKSEGGGLFILPPKRSSVEDEDDI